MNVVGDEIEVWVDEDFVMDVVLMDMVDGDDMGLVFMLDDEIICVLVVVVLVEVEGMIIDLDVDVDEVSFYDVLVFIFDNCLIDIDFDVDFVVVGIDIDD